MLFNHIEFIFFLPIVILLYFLTPSKYRWVLLLAASYYFYMCWKVEYIFLIIFSTLIDYFSGLKMSSLASKKKRRPYLIISLASNLGLLFTFKYFNFFSENLNLFFQKFNMSGDIPLMKVLLPVGISFYTFQTLSYSIDVYFGKQKAEKHLGYFALYVSFFPQLVAGPIERFSRLTPQLKEKQFFTYNNLANGLRLILFGLFIKMVIADNLSGIVDLVYISPESFSSLDISTSIFFYSFQIYSDFFGYSLVAIGSAQIMGIKLMDNFKTPYLSKSIAEFWQRWHISLSTWFRDYLYYPIGGNQVAKTRWVFNILIVFVVSGFWHGANWTFLIWGALFGTIYLIEKVFEKVLDFKKSKIISVLLMLKTFILVSLIWIFFRSQSLNEALEVFHSLFTNSKVTLEQLEVPPITWGLLLFFIFIDLFLYDKRFDSWVSKLAMPLRWTTYCILIFSIIVLSGVDDFAFIYFRF